MKIECACGCKKELEDTDAEGRKRRYVNGHNTPKKYDDPTQFKREWNHRNRKARYKTKKSRHHRLKVKLIHEFGGKCSDCSTEYTGKNACIFHFHHLNPDTKDFALGNQLTNMAWDKIMAEAKKCILICANCHEIRHSEEF